MAFESSFKAIDNTLHHDDGCSTALDYVEQSSWVLFLKYLDDLELTRAVSDSVGVPVIASGGAGTMEHFYDALTEGGADAALAASLFHFKELEIREVKEYLKNKGVSVRI